MNRRGFLRLFGAALPTAVVAPKYFFATVGGWKSDVIKSPYTTYLVGQDALEPVETLRIYYDKMFVENLKQQAPFALLGRSVLPLAKGDFLRGFYTLEHGILFPAK